MSQIKGLIPQSSNRLVVVISVKMWACAEHVKELQLKHLKDLFRRKDIIIIIISLHSEEISHMTNYS